MLRPKMTPVSERPVVALVVDDEPMIRVPVAWVLQDHGFEVVEAGTGDEALAILQGGTPVDLLITDVRMPGKTDGFKLVEHARRLRGPLPIIAMSGMPWDPRARPSPIPRGFTYLQKPVPMDELLGTIDTLLAQRRPPTSRQGISANATAVPA